MEWSIFCTVLKNQHTLMLPSTLEKCERSNEHHNKFSWPEKQKYPMDTDDRTPAPALCRCVKKQHWVLNALKSTLFAWPQSEIVIRSLVNASFMFTSLPQSPYLIWFWFLYLENTEISLRKKQRETKRYKKFYFLITPKIFSFTVFTITKQKNSSGCSLQHCSAFLCLLTL